MPHHCHAVGCRVEVAPRFLMCPRHWRMVPLHIRDAVWQTYRAGQENDKRPSRSFIEAAKAAIDAARDRENEQRSLARRDPRQVELFV